jgi:hypothetical protein
MKYQRVLFTCSYIFNFTRHIRFYDLADVTAFSPIVILPLENFVSCIKRFNFFLTLLRTVLSSQKLHMLLVLSLKALNVIFYIFTLRTMFAGLNSKTLPMCFKSHMVTVAYQL